MGPLSDVPGGTVREVAPAYDLTDAGMRAEFAAVAATQQELKVGWLDFRGCRGYLSFRGEFGWRRSWGAHVR
jgi:hypothetical protein